MNITIRSKFQKDKTLPIKNYTIDELSRFSDPGQSESIRHNMDNLIDAFGRLMDTLATKGILGAPEITEIVEGYMSSNSTLEEAQ